MSNNDVLRMRIRQAGLKQWQIALAAGVAESTLTRWLRTSMSDDNFQRISRAITELSEGGGNGTKEEARW